MNSVQQCSTQTHLETIFNSD